MSRTNERRHIEWHEMSKCKCRLHASVCNNKQRLNDNKCRCECKELIDKGVWNKGSTWNPSNCEFECDKSCDVGEYLDYENCNCWKKLVDKLVERSSAEECTENIDEVKVERSSAEECTEKTDEVKIAECNSVKNIHKCNSCTLYIVLLSIIFTINIGIATYFVYYKYMNCNKENVSRYDYVYQATNYLYI